MIKNKIITNPFEFKILLLLLIHIFNVKLTNTKNNYIKPKYIFTTHNTHVNVHYVHIYIMGSQKFVNDLSEIKK